MMTESTESQTQSDINTGLQAHDTEEMCPCAHCVAKREETLSALDLQWVQEQQRREKRHQQRDRLLALRRRRST